MQNMKDELTPEVLIFQQDHPAPVTAPRGSYMHSDNIRVWPLWDVGATPMFGRWKIRIDIYQPKETDPCRT